MDAAILRTSMGSAVQLPSYIFTKTQLVKRGILPENSPWTFLASSSVSGIIVCGVMQPADTASFPLILQSRVYVFSLTAFVYRL